MPPVLPGRRTGGAGVGQETGDGLLLFKSQMDRGGVPAVVQHTNERAWETDQWSIDLLPLLNEWLALPPHSASATTLHDYRVFITRFIA